MLLIIFLKANSWFILPAERDITRQFTIFIVLFRRPMGYKTNGHVISVFLGMSFKMIHRLRNQYRTKYRQSTVDQSTSQCHLLSPPQYICCNQVALVNINVFLRNSLHTSSVLLIQIPPHYYNSGTNNTASFVTIIWVRNAIQCLTLYVTKMAQFCLP